MARWFAPRAEHRAEFGPVFVRPRPPREGNRGAVDSQQSAAGVYEPHQVPSQLDVFEKVPHGIVEEHGVESLELLGGKDRRVVPHFGLESPGLAAHQGEGHRGVGGGAVPAVAHVTVEDQQPPRLLRRCMGLRRQRLLDLRLLFGGNRGRGLGAPRRLGRFRASAHAAPITARKNAEAAGNAEQSRWEPAHGMRHLLVRSIGGGSDGGRQGKREGHLGASRTARRDDYPLPARPVQDVGNWRQSGSKAAGAGHSATG